MIEAFKNVMPEYAKDIKLNLSAILTEEGAPDLTQKQIYFIALAAAFAVKNKNLIDALLAEHHQLSAEEITAAKSAAVIMAMNNVYYRFVHLVSDKNYAAMPAKLRMSVIGNPGIDKVDFELASLAVSAINACGMCIDAHANELMKKGISKTGIQSCVRIAAVINAAAFAESIAAI